MNRGVILPCFLYSFFLICVACGSVEIPHEYETGLPADVFPSAVTISL